MWTLETVSLVFLIFLAGGVVKGIVGLGFPIVVLAGLAATVGLKEAMGLLIIPGIVTNVWQALAGGAFFEITRRLWPLLLTSFAGIGVGVHVLSTADTALLVAALGVLLFVYSAISLARPQIPPPDRHEIWLSPLIGAGAGVVFGMTGSYMVPGVLYIQALGLTREMFVQALGIVFCWIMIALGLFMSGNRLIPPETAMLSAAGLAPTALGMLIGQNGRHFLSEQRFRKVFFTALCVAGLYMIARSAL
jgi:uncharacterized membrane protein YfcA